MMNQDPLMSEEIAITRRQFIDVVQQQLSVKKPIMASHQAHGTAQRMWRELGGTDHRPQPCGANKCDKQHKKIS